MLYKATKNNHFEWETINPRMIQLNTGKDDITAVQFTNRTYFTPLWQYQPCDYLFC